jgi:hypothetical protein
MNTFPVPSREIGSVAAEEFRACYFDAGEPVLLRGFLRSWPAYASWTPAAFAARFGEESIEVMLGGRQANAHDFGPYRAVHTTTMAKFAALLREGSDDDIYLVAQNQLLRRPAFAALWDDMAFDPGWLHAQAKEIHVSLWMGPENAVTPLHFDLRNALLAQAYGRKRVILAAPADTPYLYKGGNGYARVDPERPDFNAFPAFREAKLFDATLEHGDALFLPFGWWHHVRSLTASISLSISNFAWVPIAA